MVRALSLFRAQEEPASQASGGARLNPDFQRSQEAAKMRMRLRNRRRDDSRLASRPLKFVRTHRAGSQRHGASWEEFQMRKRKTRDRLNIRYVQAIYTAERHHSGKEIWLKIRAYLRV